MKKAQKEEDSKNTESDIRGRGGRVAFSDIFWQLEWQGDKIFRKKVVPPHAPHCFIIKVYSKKEYSKVWAFTNVKLDNHYSLYYGVWRARLSDWSQNSFIMVVYKNMFLFMKKTENSDWTLKKSSHRESL